MVSKKSIKTYIVEEFMPNSHIEDLPDELDLLVNGILDSLAVLKMVAYIENKYDIALEPEELDPEIFNSVNAIQALIEAASKKRETQGG